jgi:hypothetical protein
MKGRKRKAYFVFVNISTIKTPQELRGAPLENAVSAA